MSRKPLLSLLAACLLCSCADGHPPADAGPGQSGADAARAAPTAIVPAAAPIGHYTLAGTRVDLHDAVLLPAAEGELSMLLAPTELTAEERGAVLASTSFPGLSLMGKRTGDYPDRYPFVVVELKYAGSPSASTVRSFYVLASSIGEPHHTDNINGIPGVESSIELLERREGRVRMKFAGGTEISGVARSWAFDVDVADGASVGG